MMKKLIALAAGAVFSLHASAGYVQYNFSGPISGYFVQHDDDGSIAYYDFQVPLPGVSSPYLLGDTFQPLFGEGSDIVSGPTTHFQNNGPTNLKGHDDFGNDHEVNLTIDFSRSTQGAFSYTAQYSAWFYTVPQSFSGSGTLSGLVTAGAADGALVTYLDSVGGYYDGLGGGSPQYIGPSQVPEPASLALLATGALGALIARRRKSAS